jgi:hypothetical protein
MCSQIINPGQDFRNWSDPTSLEAFGRAVDRIASHRVLLIVTFRPEFESPWIGRPHVTALTHSICCPWRALMLNSVDAMAQCAALGKQ